MPPDASQNPSDEPPDAHARFMRLFLSREKEIFRYVAALAPKIADAQDIVQQTAIALWRKFDLYDPTRKQLIWRGDATKTIDLKKTPLRDFAALTRLHANS